MKTILIALLISFAFSTELSVAEEDQLTWNPEGLLKCLTEAAPYAKDIIELINLIKNKDYGAAFEKAIALITSESELIKRCIEYIVGSSVELTMDWYKLAECLLEVARTLGLYNQLRDAIRMRNIPQLIYIINIIKDRLVLVPVKCKRFW